MYTALAMAIFFGFMIFNDFFFLLPVDIGLSAVLEPDFQIVIKIFVSDCNNVFIWLRCLSLFFFSYFLLQFLFICLLLTEDIE